MSRLKKLILVVLDTRNEDGYNENSLQGRCDFMDNKEPTADLMQLSVKLSTLRKKSGCEQRSVAKAVGVAASALSAFENGQRIPSLEQTVALAQY